MARSLTRLALLAAATAAGSPLLLGCSDSCPTNASTATDGPGEFHFTGSTPFGHLIPVEAHQLAPVFRGELLDSTAVNAPRSTATSW